MAERKRIALADEQWADIRVELTFKDIRAQQLQRARDGRTEYDPMLDAMATFQTRIVEWSYGPVDDETIDALSAGDTLTLVRAILGLEDDSPNPSSPSRAGTRRTKAKNETTEETPPGNGE